MGFFTNQRQRNITPQEAFNQTMTAPGLLGLSKPIKGTIGGLASQPMQFGATASAPAPPPPPSPARPAVAPFSIPPQGLQPTPQGLMQQRYQEMAMRGAEKAGGGLGSRLGSAALGFFMGGLPGAVIGGVNPQVVKNIQHQQGLAQLAKLADVESEFENRRFNQQLQTQRMNEEQAWRQKQWEEWQRDNQRQDDAAAWTRRKGLADLARQQDEDEYKRAKDISTQRADMGKAGAVPMPGLGNFWFNNPQAKQQMGANQGLVVPNLDPSQPGYRLPSAEQEQQRKLALEREKGKAELELDIEKRKQMSPLELEEFRRKEEIRQQYNPKESPEYKAAKARWDDAEKDRERIQALINRAAKQDEEAKAETDPDKRAAKLAAAQGDWDSARRELDIALQRYPDLIEGGAGAGGYPNVGIKPEPQPPAVQRTSSSTSRSPRSTGTAKDISQEVFDHTVKTRFGGDVAAAKADAKRRGYTIGGKAIE